MPFAGRSKLAGAAELVRDVVRASYELAIARWRIGRSAASDLLGGTAEGRSASAAQNLGRHSLAERIAFVIPRVAARLPWRADCLVQALAAQRWLDRRGIASQLSIGVRKASEGQMEAHAWLIAEGRLITGGDISGYVPLFTPEVASALLWNRDRPH